MHQCSLPRFPCLKYWLKGYLFPLKSFDYSGNGLPSQYFGRFTVIAHKGGSIFRLRKVPIFNFLYQSNSYFCLQYVCLFIIDLSRLGLFPLSEVQAFNSKHVYTILILSDQDQSSYDHIVGIISLNRFVNAINLYQIILLYTFYVKSFPHYEFALPLNQDLTFCPK